MSRRKPKAPVCMHCDGVEASLVTGAVVLPKRGDLAKNNFWLCPDCGAFCGCIRGTKKADGRPANRELRDAREKLRAQRIDPVWTCALDAVDYEIDHRDVVARKMVLNAAKKRTYEWLADQIGFDGAEARLSMMTLEECRVAWRALGGVTYPTIRNWAKSRKEIRDLDEANEKAALVEASAA